MRKLRDLQLRVSNVATRLGVSRPYTSLHALTFRSDGTDQTLPTCRFDPARLRTFCRTKLADVSCLFSFYSIISHSLILCRNSYPQNRLASDHLWQPMIFALQGKTLLDSTNTLQTIEQIRLLFKA